MIAAIKTYPTNADVWVDGIPTLTLEYDYQDRNFFETEQEVIEQAEYLLEPIRNVDNYEDILADLAFTLKNYYCAL